MGIEKQQEPQYITTKVTKRTTTVEEPAKPVARN